MFLLVVSKLYTKFQLLSLSKIAILDILDVNFNIRKTILEFNLDFMQFDFSFVGPLSFPLLLKASNNLLKASNNLVSQEGLRGIEDWKSHLMQKTCHVSVQAD